jgi:hypothetical protein
LLTARRKIMMKRVILLSIFSLLLLSTNTFSTASTTIDNVLVFTENRLDNDLFGFPGLRFRVVAIVSDPLGVPSNIQSARAIGLRDGDTYGLSYFYELGEHLFVNIPPYTGQSGRYKVVLTNKQGHTIERTSHDLNHSDPLPLPQNLTVTGTFSAAPIFSFDPIPEATHYVMKIVEPSSRIVYRESSTTPIFPVPTDILEPGQNYYLTARGEHIDYTEPYEGVSRLERRSRRDFPYVSRKIHGLFIGVTFPKEGHYYKGDEEAAKLWMNFSKMDNVGEMMLITNRYFDLSYDLLSSAIETLNKKMNPYDILYIFVGSHGYYNSVGVETTATPGNEYLILGFDLEDDQMHDLLKGIDDIFKVVLLAGCNTGGFWGNHNPNDHGDLEKLRKIALFAAANEGESSWSYPDGTAFGRALIDGFSLSGGRLNADMNGDGFVEYAELREWMTSFFRAANLDGSIGYEMGPGDPIILTEDDWNPVSFKSEDFDAVLATKTPLLPNTTDVNIDIMPGENPNVINRKSKGLTPVAILSWLDFDASTIDAESVEFAGARAARWNLEDIDSNGTSDLILHFKTHDLLLFPEDTSAELIGQTFDGVIIKGMDSVLIVK